MTLEEQKAHIAAMQDKRSKIQKEIQDLSKERDRYVAEERKKLAEDGEDTLDKAMIKAIREQGNAKGYTFEEPSE